MTVILTTVVCLSLFCSLFRSDTRLVSELIEIMVIFRACAAPAAATQAVALPLSLPRALFKGQIEEHALRLVAGDRASLPVAICQKLHLHSDFAFAQCPV